MSMPRLSRDWCAAFAFIALLLATRRSEAQALQFYNLAPCRAVDTRGGYGGRVPGATLRNFQIKGFCGVPTDAKTVTLNVTAVSPTHGGFLVLWPAGGTIPGVSNLNFNDGEPAIANGAVVPLAAGNPDLSLAYGAPLGASDSVDVVLDVTGYFK
jgi:hypothetical protein